jgi:hypothetical protein
MEEFHAKKSLTRHGQTVNRAIAYPTLVVQATAVISGASPSPVLVVSICHGTF